MLLSKTIFCVAIIGCIIGDGPCFAVDKITSFGEGGYFSEYKNILLEQSHLPEYKKELEIAMWWPYGLDANGKPVFINGFVQRFEKCNAPISTRIQYGRFSDVDTARKALVFHESNVAAIFQQEDPMPDIPLKEIPDEIMFHGSGGILFREGKTCVLITCRDGSPMEQRRSAVLFADAVMDRLLALQDVAETPEVDAKAYADTSDSLPDKEVSQVFSAGTNGIPILGTPSTESSPKSSKFPWWLLLCLGGLIALGWRFARKKRG
jgi:hypothetical protein